MNTRHLKVYESPNPYTDIPRIVLQGKWLDNLGFHIHESIEVSYKNGTLIIKLPDNTESK